MHALVWLSVSYITEDNSPKSDCAKCVEWKGTEKKIQCAYYEPHFSEETVALRSPMVFSNLYGCNIEYKEIHFNSVEQTYQYTQANTVGSTEVAAKIMTAVNG